MKWAHLPVAGGLYDQDPELLDRWRIMFAKRAEHEEERHEREQQKQRQQSARTRMRPSRAQR